MQRKSEIPQLVTVEGNNLPEFMSPVNSLEIKELMDKAKYLGQELKEIILFITLSILLLIGISLLPQSPAPVREGATTAVPISTSTSTSTSTVKATLTATAP